MLAGLLKQRITVQAKSPTGTGDRGQPLFTWQDETTGIPAEVVELAGRKLELARQLVATATHQVTMRYLSSLVPTKRITLGGRIFNIGNIQNLNILNFTNVVLVTEQETGG